MKKCLFIISLVILILFSSMNLVYGFSGMGGGQSSGGGTGRGDVLNAIAGNEDKKDILNWSFKFNSAEKLPDTLASLTGRVIQIINAVSVIITVIVITIVGVKYMMESVEERAADKKKFINIVIGVVMMTVLTSVISAIFTLMDGFINT